MSISKTHRRALAIIGECSDGVTTYALARLNGVRAETMADLIRAKLVWAEQQHIKAIANALVIRLRITDKGRQQLRGSDGTEKTNRPR